MHNLTDIFEMWNKIKTLVLKKSIYSFEEARGSVV
jgi:hypothetical protein